MSFNMWFYICYYFFETSAADGKQKRIINVNVIQVVSALLLSITRYITTNVCSVFKWQQLDIENGQDVPLKISLLVLYLPIIRTLWRAIHWSTNIIRISFFTLVFFSRNCMFCLKQSLHMQWPWKYYIRSFRCDKQEHVFLTFKVILLSTSKIYLVYKTLDLVDK